MVIELRHLRHLLALAEHGNFGRAAEALHLTQPPLMAQTLLAAAPAGTREGLRRRGLLTIECDSSTVLKSIMIESDAVSNMPRFMVEAELRAGQLTLLPHIDMGLRVRFGAAWLRQRAAAA